MDFYGGNISNKNKDKVSELLEIFGLNSIKEIRNEDLSIGQRRRVQIDRECVHETDLLFLGAYCRIRSSSKKKSFKLYKKTGKARSNNFLYSTYYGRSRLFMWSNLYN